MTEFQIERGVEIPIRLYRQSRYPFDAMEVGESFVVKLNGRRSWAGIFSAMKTAQDRLPGRKFTSRLISDSERRIWRTA